MLSNQLYVLLPVLDESKHYWQADDEVDKLLRSGGAWLAGHPEQTLIARRYLGRRGTLMRQALERLAELGDDTDEAVEPASEEEVAQPEENRVPLNAQRHAAVLKVIRESGATSVIDLGCGTGQFLTMLVGERGLTRVAGADVSAQALASAVRRLHLERMSERQRERVLLFQGALTYEDERFAGYDAAVLMEVIEHVDPPRLGALERVVFGRARPGVVVVTTPERRVQRALRGRQRLAARRPSLRVDARRVRRVVRPRHLGVRLHGHRRRGRRRRPRAGRADAARRVPAAGGGR